MDLGKSLILMSAKISWDVRPFQLVDAEWHY